MRTRAHMHVMHMPCREGGRGTEAGAQGHVLSGLGPASCSSPYLCPIFLIPHARKSCHIQMRRLTMLMRMKINALAPLSCRRVHHTHAGTQAHTASHTSLWTRAHTQRHTHTHTGTHTITE